MQKKKPCYILPTKRPGACTGGAGLIMLEAGAKNSSVTETMEEPRAEEARSINEKKGLVRIYKCL